MRTFLGKEGLGASRLESKGYDDWVIRPGTKSTPQLIAEALEKEGIPQSDGLKLEIEKAELVAQGRGLESLAERGAIATVDIERMEAKGQSASMDEVKALAISKGDAAALIEKIAQLADLYIAHKPEFTLAQAKKEAEAGKGTMCEGKGQKGYSYQTTLGDTDGFGYLL